MAAIQDTHGFEKLAGILDQIPAVKGVLNSGSDAHRVWWIEFSIDIKHRIAWNVIQEISHILNYASYDEELVSVFKPVSPPPYKAGGPDESLTWTIESRSESFSPGTCAVWLQNKLPDPIDSIDAWY